MRPRKKRDEVDLSIPAAVVALMRGVLAIPLGVGAQQTAKVYRLGFLYGIPVGPGALVFEEALRNLGWVKGRNIAIEYRSAEGHLDRLPAFAAELVALRVDVIIANSAPEAGGLLAYGADSALTADASGSRHRMMQQLATIADSVRAHVV